MRKRMTTKNSGAPRGARTLVLWAALPVMACAFLTAPVSAQATREPTLPIAWNRFYDYDGIVDICRRLAGTWPDKCRLEFIGESVEGRPLPLLTISNPATGSEADKCGMWVDGNVHGNEVQGSEAAVYLAWTLLERYGELDNITEVVDERVFYIYPMVNPDGRQHWFDAPNTMHSSRSGKRPTDNDGDGLADEDGADDLDGDGELLSMRKRVAPGTGTHVLSEDDPRVMVRVPADKRVQRGADYLRLGQEGYDNDDDGRVNEDGPGGYDMNRNWPAGWRPRYIQYGAGDYPFSFPETKAIGEFILSHPNIAAVQSFHNSGGMILRGPGAEARKDYYGSADRRTYDAIADDGEAILPHYRSLVIFDDLYDVHGGFVDWTAEGLGIISFTNELWASTQYFGDVNGDGDLSFGGNTERMLKFDDLVLFGETFVDWHEVEHPQYGTVEVGGFRKMTGRVPPPFMIEEMLHRNAAFCVFHAEQMPRLEVLSLDVEQGPAGARIVTLEVRNTRWIPTRTAVAADKGIGRPDIVTIQGDDLSVVAGGRGADRFDRTDFDVVEYEPARLQLDRGIPGHGTERLRWIVRGSGEFSITLDSQFAPTLTATGTL
jgi:hypothetical protein